MSYAFSVNCTRYRCCFFRASSSCLLPSYRIQLGRDEAEVRLERATKSERVCRTTIARRHLPGSRIQAEIQRQDSSHKQFDKAVKALKTVSRAIGKIT